LRRTDVVTRGARAGIDRTATRGARLIDARGGVRRRLQIENPLFDPRERGEVQRFRCRAGANRCALVAFLDAIVIAIPMESEAATRTLIPQ